MVEPVQPTVSHEGELWLLRVPQDNGKIQVYRCSSENQARQLLLVLAPPVPPPKPSA